MWHRYQVVKHRFRCWLEVLVVVVVPCRRDPGGINTWLRSGQILCIFGILEGVGSIRLACCLREVASERCLS